MHLIRSLSMLFLFLVFASTVLSQTPNFNIVALNPVTTSSGGIDSAGLSRLMGFYAAVEDINNDPSFNFTLNEFLVDSQRNSTVARNGAQNLLQTIGDAVAIIGAHSSGVSADVHEAVAEPNQIPLISPASTASLLSDPVEYPYFLRTLPAGAGPTTDAFVSIINYYEPGAGIAIIVDPSIASIAIKNSTIASAQAAGNPILETIILEESDNMTTAVTTLKESNATIFVFKVEGRTAELFKEAKLQGITGPGYQYIGTSQELSANSYTIDGGVDLDALEGSENLIAPSLSAGSGPLFDSFLESYERERQQYFNTSIVEETPNSRASRAYDAVYAVANAIQIVLDNSEDPYDGSELIFALRNNVSFTGVVGQIEFSAETNDLASANVFNVFRLTEGLPELIGGHEDPFTSITANDDVNWKQVECVEIIQDLSNSWPGGMNRAWNVRAPDHPPIVEAKLRSVFSVSSNVYASWNIDQIANISNREYRFELGIQNQFGISETSVFNLGHGITPDSDDYAFVFYDVELANGFNCYENALL